MSIKVRLIIMNFLQFFVWGSWLISLGGYMGRELHFEGGQIGAIFATMGIASLVMPGIIGIIADKWFNAERLYGLCHIVGAACLFYASTATGYDQMYWAMLLNLLVYMPTLSLANTVSYNALEQYKCDLIKDFPPIRVWGTIGFICAMWAVDLTGFKNSSAQLYVGAISALLLGVYSFTLPACKPAKTENKSLLSAFGLDALVLFKRKKMAIFFLFSMLLGAALQITNTYGDLFLGSFAGIPEFADSFGVKHSVILLSISQMSETLFILAIPFFLKHFGIKQVMLISMFAWVFRFGLFGFGDPGGGLWMLILSMIVYGMAFDFFNISGSLFVEQETNSSIRASAQGLFFMMTNGLGAIIGGYASGAVVDAFSVYADGKLEEWKDETSRFPALVQAFCIHEDSNHHIWIGSSVGLYKSDNTTPRPLTRYSTYDGLPNNFIYGILEDGRGRLWITTNHGLSCFDPSEQTFLNYSVKDGLSHNQFNTYGACQTKDGIIYLGSLKGITYFNPYQFVDNPYSPNAVITGATIQNQPVTNIRDGVSKYFQASNGKLLGMSFPANRKTFSIRFSVINYLSGRRNLFAYQLEGFDDNWISSAQAISQRGVTYSNLPPGKYTFRVKACNNNGRWSLTPTEFFVHITPMWYQTWWAKTLYVLLTLGGIAFILYFFIARAKMKMQVQIEHLERMKVEEVSQEKVRFYINMSHELRTPLSLILAPLEELVEEKSKFDLQEQQKLSYIYRNGRKLLHLINQLLDFRKAESGALPIHVAMNQVDKLAKNIFTMFEENAQKRNITYEYQSDLKDDLLPVDKMYVEMMLTNLLSNAFKFTREGYIHLGFEVLEGKIQLYVEDTGQGISQEHIEHIFDRFYKIDSFKAGTGLGLSICKTIVNRLQGDITVRSEIGKGTRFLVDLPVNMNIHENK